MAIIFSAGGLERVRPRCVCQSFINHNAVLYKVFVVGESHTLVERPSLKNFPSGPAGEEPHTHTHTHSHTYTYPYTHTHTLTLTHTHTLKAPWRPVPDFSVLLLLMRCCFIPT